MAGTTMIIDTDGGVDDAAALWWALTHPDIDVLALTTVWGNGPVAVGTSSVAKVLDACGHRDVPFAVGADHPIESAPTLMRPSQIHGMDGLGDTNRPASSLRPVDEPAAVLMRRLVRERPGDVVLVTIGPLTNVARAILDDPSFAPAVARLVVMGGAAHATGNALPAGEANIAHDPAAAQIVATAPWREAPTMVGLDVTHAATLTEAEFDLLAEHRTAAASFLDEPLRFYRRFGGTFCAPGECPAHDLLAVMVAHEPSLLTDAPVLPMAVDCGGGPAWGATIVDHRAPHFARAAAGVPELAELATQMVPPGFAPWRVGLGVDVARFRSLLRAMLGA
jgi:purine nucleosidase